MRHLPRTVRIVGTGMTPVGKLGLSATTLMKQSLESALADANLQLNQVDGLIAVPSLSEPRFMQAHYLGTHLGLLPSSSKLMRTIDTGGAGPVTGIIQAAELINRELCDVVAVVGGDAVSSLDTSEFLRRADAGCQDPLGSQASPVIPRGYDRIAKWQMDKYNVTREQLAMCSVIMSHQASRHPTALTRQPHTLEQVLGAPQVGEVTGLLECARRADGGASVILASSRYLHRKGFDVDEFPVFLGAGEASGPLYPPAVIDETMFSCESATEAAFQEARCHRDEIDFYGLYDCFPICFVRAVEAVGLAAKGGGGAWVERQYERLTDPGRDPDDVLNVNTHGGLLAFGAPWETPAMYNVIEAVRQLTGRAHGRQVRDPRRALVYGNGGIFSASAVAILGRGDIVR